MANNTDWGQRLNRFYAAQYAWLLRVMNLLLIVMGALFVTIVYQDINRPRPNFYEARADGSVIPIYALSDPMVGPRALREWATQAAVSAYTYNFVDYQQRFEETSDFFTPASWASYLDSITLSGVIDKAITQKLTVSSVSKGAAVIVNQQPISGVWTWRVQVPILVSYRGAVEPYQETLVVNMLISRVPAYEVPKGIAIQQFYSYPLGGGSAVG